MSSLRDEIADLEARIQSLSEAAERCRKFVVLSKAAAVAGGLLLAATAIGLIRFDPISLVLGITAIVAGIALTGSNRSTRDEILGRIAMHESQRRAMIDRIELRTVESV